MDSIAPSGGEFIGSTLARIARLAQHVFFRTIKACLTDEAVHVTNDIAARSAVRFWDDRPGCCGGLRPGDDGYQRPAAVQAHTASVRHESLVDQNGVASHPFDTYRDSEGSMKRIVILIDGTWDEEGQGDDTNIARLDPAYRAAGTPLIKAVAADGTAQRAFYHKGVGAEPDLVKRLLGGAIGLGLKKIVQDAYRTVVDNFAAGDEIYILGFSRGAYAARALAGLIGASGIRRASDPQDFDIAWTNYRIDPAVRAGAKPAGASDRKKMDAAAQNVHADRAIKCVGVFDTVGSYGVPAGIGLAALGRYITWYDLGFHDTRFGAHIDVGLHAVAVDEHRRPFVPTFWTAPKGEPPRGHVEQTWFAGAHRNVGGGYPDSGLSTLALVWMIARMQALTGLAFDEGRVTAVAQAANVDGEVEDSSKGWIIDATFPHERVILSPDAIEHGPAFNQPNPREENINERVHWSVMRKFGRLCTVYGKPDTPYRPLNMPTVVAPAQIAAMTPEERALLAGFVS